MSDETLVANGWEVYAHPLFLDQLEAFIMETEKARTKDPDGYRKKRVSKLLAAVLKVAFEVIPQDPTRPEYRQEDTLGTDHRHWFRAKFLQQYRLFFRYRETAGRRIIVLAWVNDDAILRAYGSRSDAYLMFQKMLRQGQPPDDWQTLISAATAKGRRGRLRRSRGGA